MLDKKRIAIITTVSSFKLYAKTSTLFPNEIDRIVIDGRNGMYGINSIDFMFKKLKNKNYEWLIMADEDVFFYDSSLIYDLILYMIKNEFDICGVRDGGVIQHRFNNPEAINTFFSIMNFKKISKEYNYNSVMSCQKYFSEFYENKNYDHLKYNYNIESLKEPYYCFYFWLHLKKNKFLYLDVKNPVEDDYVGNIILSPDGKKIAFHSWYARAYELFDDQTIRINFYLNYFNIENSSINWKQIIIMKKSFFNWKKRFKKTLKGWLQYYIHIATVN